MTASARQVSASHRAAEPVEQTVDGERGKNEAIRKLLHHYGLRATLFRLKVIDALLLADRSNLSLYVNDIHAHVGAELSCLNMREVIRRLTSEGVIHMSPDKRYSLTPQARALLDQGGRNNAS
nr:fe2+ zn2+ uptake regulation protein [Pseudomonas sp. R5(2019)]